jgi:hypothetical protein
MARRKVAILHLTSVNPLCVSVSGKAAVLRRTESEREREGEREGERERERERERKGERDRETYL